MNDPIKKSSIYTELLDRTDIDDKVLAAIAELDARRNNLKFVTHKFPVVSWFLGSAGFIGGLVVGVLFL